MHIICIDNLSNMCSNFVSVLLIYSLKCPYEAFWLSKGILNLLLLLEEFTKSNKPLEALNFERSKVIYVLKYYNTIVSCCNIIIL